MDRVFSKREVGLTFVVCLRWCRSLWSCRHCGFLRGVFTRLLPLCHGDMSALIPKARKKSTSCHLLLYVPYIFMLCRLGPQHRAAHFLGMRALLCGTQLPLAAFVGLLPFFYVDQLSLVPVFFRLAMVYISMVQEEVHLWQWLRFGFTWVQIGCFSQTQPYVIRNSPRQWHRCSAFCPQGAVWRT